MCMLKLKRERASLMVSRWSQQYAELVKAEI